MSSIYLTMKNLHPLQNDIIEFLVYQQDKADKHVADTPPIDKATRLHIYSNAYYQTLRGVIDTDHELLSFYLDDDLFNKLVEKLYKSKSLKAHIIT